MVANAVVTDWPSGSANQGWPQEPTRMLMPGRVEGWPAGTQRAANSAERLLTQAVAWWDVGQYREGDRFLRNRGTGGELLNLRLGSSIAPNSNDPLYLPSADDGYVYLSGVAGNSLSVTAPATATQYIAYPLDGSASTATGAVVGGATFTFSTTGSWRLIELLDASNVVVDTIDCDVITSGSATSFTSGIVNQTVTINRSSGDTRRSVAMPSRSKGGHPTFLFGADDFMECLDSWQHNLLNFGQGDSFSVLMVNRVHLAAGDRIWINKINGVSGETGWRLGTDFSQRFGTWLADGNNANRLYPSTNPQYPLSSLGVMTLTVDRGRRILTPYVGSVAGTSVSTSSLGSLVNQSPIRIGVASWAVANPASMEFYAAAIKRGVWTPSEIAVLANHYTGRIA